MQFENSYRLKKNVVESKCHGAFLEFLTIIITSECLEFVLVLKLVNKF